MKNTADHDPLVPELWSLIPPLFVRFCKGLFSDFLSIDSLELTFKKRSLKHIKWPYWEVSITHYLGVWSLIPHLCNIVPVTWQLCATPYRTSKTHRMDAATLLIVTDEDRDPQNNNAYLKVRRLNEVAGLWCFHLKSAILWSIRCIHIRFWIVVFLYSHSSVLNQADFSWRWRLICYCGFKIFSDSKSGN